MPTFQTYTAASLMEIVDDGTYVYFYLTPPFDMGTAPVYVPWTSTIDGVVSGLKSHRSSHIGNRELFGTFLVTTSQTVNFHISATGYPPIGGPTDLAANIVRSGSGGGGAGSSVNTKVTVAGLPKTAYAFVRVGGVWKAAIPFVKQAGVWKQIT